MLMHGMFGDRLFDDAFWEDGAFEREFFGKNSPMYAKSAKRLMNTDVVEQSDRYEVKMDLPGFHKEDIQVHLENGYLTVSANKNINQDEKDENGKFLRQERYSGSLRRSFYVGNTLKAGRTNFTNKKSHLRILLREGSLFLRISFLPVWSVFPSRRHTHRSY